MKSIHLIVIGKNKEDSLNALESDYLKRLKSVSLRIHELKHYESKEKNDQNAINKARALSGRQNPEIILLDERGKTLTSNKFSSLLFDKLQLTDNLFFVIGGAEGHGDQIKSVAKSSIRLSDFTLPHRLARTIFVEQIYRAETINLGHPYHK
jgi:23S rRNA (pseudouridine1915-N3)-methyltransferase